jgi:hypothetical protein
MPSLNPFISSPDKVNLLTYADRGLGSFPSFAWVATKSRSLADLMHITLPATDNMQSLLTSYRWRL